MRVFLVLALLPLTAFANTRGEYVREWPLTLSADNAGAYRVVLNEAVYRSVHRASVADLDVFNADGEPVAAEVFTPEKPMAQAASTVELPWFELPADSSGSSDLQLVAERNADGSVLKVEARVVGSEPKTTVGWLVDASRVHENLEAIEIEWAPVAGPLEETLRVEGSNDLRSWEALNSGATMLDLHRDGERLVRRRIEFRGTYRYLRMVPTNSDSKLSLTRVNAELARVAGEENWQWLELQGKQVTSDAGTFFEFTLPGRFPIERVDVDLPGNSAIEWTLQSHDSKEAEWTHRTGPWMAFQLNGDGEDSRSNTQALASTVRDRHWRLSPRNPVGQETPVLRVGYRPEVVVFLAQGKTPFSLAAGSGSALRNSAPIAALLQALKQQRGDAWQPTPAYLADKPTTLSGPPALQERPATRHWTIWMLWALLVAGAVVVGTIAVSLLRGVGASSGGKEA